MKLDVCGPSASSTSTACGRDIGRIEAGAEGLRLGALARMTQLADDPAVHARLSRYRADAAAGRQPAVAQHGEPRRQRAAAHALPLLSRPRWTACNKREPGSGCAALDGDNRKHAILGVSDRCISNYPGDFAQALVALDARVETAGPAGARTLRFEELHRGPDTPHIETVLQPGEFITGFLRAGRAMDAPLALREGARPAELRVRGWPAPPSRSTSGLTARCARRGSVSAAWPTSRGAPTKRRLSCAASESTKRRAIAAGRVAFEGAAPRQGNAFKTELGPRTVARALLQASRLQA